MSEIDPDAAEKKMVLDEIKNLISYIEVYGMRPIGLADLRALYKRFDLYVELQMTHKDISELDR